MHRQGNQSGLNNKAFDTIYHRNGKYLHQILSCFSKNGKRVKRICTK